MDNVMHINEVVHFELYFFLLVLFCFLKHQINGALNGDGWCNSQIQSKHWVPEPKKIEGDVKVTRTDADTRV